MKSTAPERTGRRHPKDYTQCKSLEDVVHMSRFNVVSRGTGPSYSVGHAPWELLGTMERQRNNIAYLQADISELRKRLRQFRYLPQWQELMVQFEKAGPGTHPDKPGIYLALRPSKGEWMPTRWDGLNWLTAVTENIEEWAHL